MNIEDFIKLLSVWVVGVITTIAVFRAKFTRIDDRFEKDKELRAMERQHDKDLLKVELDALRRSVTRAHRVARRIEQRQQFSLDVTMDIANKLGLQHRRFADFSVRATKEANDEEGGE